LRGEDYKKEWRIKKPDSFIMAMASAYPHPSLTRETRLTMRFLLIAIVILAVAVLLRGSWQAGRRPFYLTLGAVVVAALVFIAAWLFTERERQVAADPSTVQVSIEQVRTTETGFRLVGDVANLGEHAVSGLRVRAQALRCPPASACEVLYQQEVPVLMHIPPGGRYPLSLLVDRPAQPISPDRWRVSVLSVNAYQG
tara:strand:+ start:22400 stop:22990 length:591 start_codon:yes stop_codon:yes gene_type:complete